MIVFKPSWVLAVLLFYSTSFFAQSRNTSPAASTSVQTKPESKVNIILLKLYDGTLLSGESESLVFDKSLLLIKDDKVLIEATAISDGKALANELQSLSAEDIQVYKRIVNAWIPIRNIPDLEKLEELKLVNPVYRPETNIGSVDSEGDSALAAKQARLEFCLDGNGVKVGVLSDSYNSKGGAPAGVASGDLPGPGNPNGYLTPVTNVADLVAGSGTDEGRAMCEIVHDIAPGSQLYFATAFTGQAGFAGYIQSLYNVHGCDVIVDDVSYFAEPFYLDGIIAQACDYVKANGVSYFSSAGNQAQNSYERPFASNGGSKWHDFNPGAGVDTMQSITVTGGASIRLTLQWDDPWFSYTPSGASTDMDLYIYNSAGTTVLAQSLASNIGADPIEFIGVTVPGSGPVNLNIAIKKYNGPAPANLKWVMWVGGGVIVNDFPTTNSSGQSTCVGHANAAGAIAVGACDWADSPAYGVNPPVAEWFTSSGGTLIRLDLNGNAITPVDRFKPEITASDGVSNTFFGGGNKFYGTSAAAPHAAAVAALMLEANSGLSPTEVRDVLKNSAIDMNTSGFDYLTGAGLIQADLAIQEVYDNLCNISAMSVSSGPDLEPGDSTYTVEIKVEFEGTTCKDSIVVNGEKFQITDPDSMKVVFAGLEADGLPVDVMASMSASSACSLSVNALYLAPSKVLQLDTLVITEIMYDPPESGQDSSEFIEIFNPMSISVNLGGYYLSQGVVYTFGNYILAPKEYVVICGDSISMYDNYGVSAFEWTSGVLVNTGEDIVLKDSFGRTIDSVNYDDSSPWPTNAKGKGPSVVLCNINSDNSVGSNWVESTSLAGKTINGIPLKGSPGAPDAACGPCPIPDSTFASSFTCDSSLAGSSTQLFKGVSGCDSVHTVNVAYKSGDSTTLSTVFICDGDSAIIFGLWQTVAGTYYDTLINKEGCDSLLIQKLNVNPGYDEVLPSISICSGDSIFIFGAYQKLAGVYVDTLSSSEGCDSILSVELIVDSLIHTSETLMVCNGDSIIVFGQYENVAGIYSDTSTSLSGCDSIHSITLDVLPISLGNAALSICEGDSALVGAFYYQLAGTYYDTLAATNGCDSIVSVLLSVIPLDTTYQNLTTNDPGKVGIFDSTYTNLAGCDSTVIFTISYVPPASLDTLVITEIMYNPPESGTDSLEFIEIYNPMSSAVNMSGYTISSAVNFVFGSTVIQAGDYVVVSKDSVAMYSQFGVSAYQWGGTLSNTGEVILLKDAFGNTIDSVKYSNSGAWPGGADGDGPSIVLCDPTADNALGGSWTESTTNTGIIIDGNLLKGSPGADDVACGSCPRIDSTTVYEVTCDSSLAGITVVVLPNIYGCDSTVSTITVYDPGSLSPLPDKEICDGDSIMVFGMYQSVAGMYFDTVSNVNGCDSVLSCLVIVHSTYNTSLPDEEVCAGDSVLIFGAYQSLASTYFDTVQSIHGCDSILSKILVLKRVDTVNLFTTTVDSTLAGVFDTIYTNRVGCDSIVITTVTYVPVPCINDSISITVFVCDSSLAGLSMVSYPKNDGCDSVVTTTAVYDAGSTTILPVMEICQGDSVSIFGIYRLVAGTYYDTIQNRNGCDSILSSMLIVNPSSTTSETMTICDGDSISVFGKYKSIAGLYSDTIQGFKGCDSIHNVSLIVLPASTINVSDSICPGDSRFVGGEYQTTAGVYTDTLLGINGCDSIVITTLSIRTDPGCGSPGVVDSLTVVSNSGWMKSTFTNLSEAGGYPWSGVSSLPALATFTLPAEIGQPRPWHSIDSVDGAYVIKSGNGVTFFRTTFNLTVDTGVSADIRSFMDDGMEIYINGQMLAREDDRDVSNSGGVPHHLIVLQSGVQLNGAGGDQEFDLVNNYRMDSLVQVGTNELIIALRNAPATSDLGGFSFRMDIKTGLPYVPQLTGFVVSDSEWQRSTVTTAGGSSWNWPGIVSLPPSNTYTEDVVLGQPYGWYSTEEVDESFAIKATENVTYYRRRFTIIDSADINVRLRSTFDENLMIFLNDSLIAGHYQHGLGNRALPAHDVHFPVGGNAVNGNAGGDMFMEIIELDFNEVLRKGDNFLMVALQNRGNDKGGFSLRLDLDKNGNPVIIKRAEQGGSGYNGQVKAELGLDFELYPNPTSGWVHIKLNESPSGDNEVTVTDVNGKILYQRALWDPETGSMDIDLGFLPGGMYMVRIRSGEIYKAKPLMRF